MAASANSVILGLPSDIEEVILTDKDHSDIVKFAFRSDDSYENIKCRIDRLLSDMDVYQQKRVASPSPAIPDHLAGIESQSLGVFSPQDRAADLL